MSFKGTGFSTNACGKNRPHTPVERAGGMWLTARGQMRKVWRSSMRDLGDRPAGAVSVVRAG
jgi:hypothetical protein